MVPADGRAACRLSIAGRVVGRKVTMPPSSRPMPSARSTPMSFPYFASAPDGAWKCTAYLNVSIAALSGALVSSTMP
jgi:hypothetical protein